MDRRSLPPLGTAGLMFAAFFTALFQEGRREESATVFFTLSIFLLGGLFIQIVAIWLKDLITDWVFLRELRDREPLEILPDDEEDAP